MRRAPGFPCALYCRGYLHSNSGTLHAARMRARMPLVVIAREGADLELDLPGTIRSTAHNAGWLDLKLVPERHNAVKLLLFLDVGGSMDDHIRVCEELFGDANYHADQLARSRSY